MKYDSICPHNGIMEYFVWEIMPFKWSMKESAKREALCRMSRINYTVMILDFR